MFVRYFLDMPLPFPEVEAALLRSPKEWVPGLASDAAARGEVLLAEVGFRAAGVRVEKRVQMELGEPVHLPSKTVLPLSWRAAGAEGLFPALEADLEVASLGPSRTQLAVSARYRPPLGALGRVADRALLHRVAEATVKDFLDRTGEALHVLVAAGA